MIVVDTTVWIDFFRAKDTDQTMKLRRLIGRELILIGDIVLVEILQAVRDDAQVIIGVTPIILRIGNSTPCAITSACLSFGSASAGCRGLAGPVCLRH